MKIDERLLDPNGEPENTENFNRILKLLDESDSVGVVVDKTLTKAGQAADAKAAGDRIKAVEGKTAEATTAKAGIMSAADKAKLDGIRKATAVAKAAGEAPTKAEFDALIDALTAAGIMGA